VKGSEIMSANVRVPRAVVKNPILLWLLIHGGDPGPDDIGPGPHGPIHHLTQVLTIHQLAGEIEDAALAKSIQAITGKAIANAAQKVAKG
jgi:hypothetical protein